MAKKTNRTSHVMDLLTNGASGEAPETVSEAASGQEKKSDVQSLSAAPAKVTVVDEGSINDRVSQEILDKLTEELKAETGNTAQTEADTAPAGAAEAGAAEVSAANSASVSEEESVSQEPPAGETVQTETSEETAPESTPQTSAGASEQADEVSTADAASQASEASENVSQPDSEPKKEPHPIIPESHFSNHTQHREYRFVNVMEQLLMRQDLDAVLKQHGVCPCPRCMSDVCALALTGLPSKYVVTSKDSISPLLSYYENKYTIPVLTEMMKACNKVRENPRHKKRESET